MADEVRCPECDARVTVPEGSAGKRLRCKKCDAVFRPDEGEAPKRRPPKRDEDRPRRPRDDDDKPRSRRAVADDDDEDQEDDRPRKKAKKAKKKSSLPFILGVCAALLLAFGAIGVVIAWSQGLFGGGNVDPFAEADKPVERKVVREPEDFSEHVTLRFVGLKDVGNGRLYPEFNYESRNDTPAAAQLYVLVYRQPRGEYTAQLNVDANRRLKGVLTIPYVRDPEMTVYVARKRIQGKETELVRVSNIIQFPDVLGKQ